MVSRINTLAFQSMNAVKVDVQVQLSFGKMVFNTVELPDIAIGESCERGRSAFSAIGLGLLLVRITVNLAPADFPKEGGHYDLIIALGLMVAMIALPAEALDGFVSIGGLSLDGAIGGVPGALLAPRHIASALVWSGVTSDVKK